MVSVVKKDTGNFIYMRVKKHNCPECGKQLKVIKMTKTVKSKTKEANNFNFSACDMPLGEKVKFIWYEFRCKDCKTTYTEEAMKAAEKQQKKEQKAAEKAEKKAAKQAAKAETHTKTK